MDSQAAPNKIIDIREIPLIDSVKKLERKLQFTAKAVKIAAPIFKYSLVVSLASSLAEGFMQDGDKAIPKTIFFASFPLMMMSGLTAKYHNHIYQKYKEEQKLLLSIREEVARNSDLPFTPYEIVEDVQPSKKEVFQIG